MTYRSDQEGSLRELLLRTKTHQEFTSTLYEFISRCITSEPIEIEKVFQKAHRPKYHALLLDTLISYQHSRILFPDRDISFNSDATKFMVISNDFKFRMRNDRSNANSDSKTQRNKPGNVKPGTTGA